MRYDPTCGALLNEDEVAIGGSDSKTHIYSIVNNSLVEVTTISTRSPGDEMSKTLSSKVLWNPFNDIVVRDLSLL